MDKQQVLTALGNVLQRKYRNYLLTGTGANARGLSDDERAFLDRVRANPSNFSISDLQDYVDGNLPDYQRRYNAARDALAAPLRQEPPAPVSSQVVGANVAPGRIPTGSAQRASDLEPGESSRPVLSSGARDVEPGEMSRPGAGPVAGAEPTVPSAATNSSQRPVGPLPVGQDYVFNRGKNRWELVETATGRSLGAVEPSGRIIPGTATSAPAATQGGGGVTSVVAEPAVDVPVPADWEQAAMEQYGGYWSIFQNNPELKKLLLDATANSWAPSKFQYEIEQTDWWKTTTEAARVFDMEEATDPATVQTKIDNRVSTISQYALQFGVRLSSETASQLARDSLRGGWSEQILQTAITNEATKSTSGVSQLRAGYIGQQIQASANSYGVRLGDTELNSWVQKWASGAESKESVDAAMREWSKVLYPSISTYIDQGRTFQDVVSPYKSIAAGLLELDPNQIDFTEPKWLAAISQEDKNGQQKLMSASQWQREIRTNRDFGFEFTKQAQDQAYAIANQMAELFGRV